ncbi:MAG TPA: glycosyltransferase [Thermodesulfobacteriota bacterium]|nr:glycosyltransferase [Thermodesulfobacteriota bacterium]
MLGAPDRLKIAFLAGIFPALSETFILNQITGLIDLGHDVDIFALERGFTEKLHGDITKYGLLSRTHYPERNPGEPLGSLKSLVLHSPGLLKRPSSLLKIYRAIKKGIPGLPFLFHAVPFFRQNYYDIIHCQFGPNGNIGAEMKELGITTAKLVTTFHGYDIRLGLSRGGDIYAPLREKGDLFLAISKYNRRQIEHMGFEPSRIVDHPVGIDIERFNYPASPAPRPGGEIRIVTIARLVREKGLEHAIKAVGILAASSPGLTIKYEIIGEGKLLEKLKSYAAEEGISHAVTFSGGRDQDYISGRLAESDIFLLSSVEEALSVALMEALASGLPAVATKVGGVSEIVSDGESGYLVQPGDPEAIAEKLGLLVSDPGARRRMGIAGRKSVEEKYDIRKLNEKLVGLYRSLLAEKGP